jgi:protein O-mannosyl-transferase
MPDARVKAGGKARTKARKRAAKAPAAPVRPSARRWWIYAAAAAAALFAAFQAYRPALSGPFVFDDNFQPYHLQNVTNALGAWITGVRPLLMFSYWLNFQVSKAPFSFHVCNVVFHVVNSGLVFLIVRKLLAMQSPPRPQANPNLIAGFAAAIFLLHPVQTESVSYIAGRSESLSVLFLFAAFAVFLYRPSPAASWKTALAVLALFAAAAATKEHTLVLAGLLVLTDYYWNPGFSFRGIWRNWRIYAPIALGSVAGLAFVFRILAAARSAGFGLKAFTWYQYFFTECRAFFVYLRLFVFPAGQNLDYDYPISRTILDHGAIFGLAAILLLAGAAFYFRRHYPLASYGFFVYVLLLAPTSSFVPIKDPLAERRLYMPMIGLLLIVAAGLQRIRVDRRKLAAGMCGVAVLLGVLTYQRNQVWASDIALWQDTVRKSPNSARDHFQLAQTYVDAGRCQDALGEFAAASRLEPPAYDLLVDWGLAYDCAGQIDQALAKLEQAAALKPSAHVYSQIGMIYARHSRWADALAALAQAEKLDSNYAYTYFYRGGVRAKTNDFAGAVADFRRALALDPSLDAARQGLAYAEQRLPAQR